MKGRVDKSMGIVTLIPEVLTRIKPTETLRLTKREVRKKRNSSDSSGNSPANILASRCTYKKNSRVNSSQTRPEVLTATGRKTMDGVRPIRVYLTIMPYLYSDRIQHGSKNRQVEAM